MSNATQPKEQEGQGRVLTDVQDRLREMRRDRKYGEIIIQVAAGDVVTVKHSETLKYK